MSDLQDRRKRLHELALARSNKAWRGKDLKKLCPIPWGERVVMHTCSNGWTIERIHEEDWWIEGILMGHCLGLVNGPRRGEFLEFYSLRDQHGISHVTMHPNVWARHRITAIGRCNNNPPERYLALIREHFTEARGTPNVQVDNDKAYHDRLVLSDEDYRDFTRFRQYRREDWRKKRGVA